MTNHSLIIIIPMILYDIYQGIYKLVVLLTRGVSSHNCNNSENTWIKKCKQRINDVSSFPFMTHVYIQIGSEYIFFDLGVE